MKYKIHIAILIILLSSATSWGGTPVTGDIIPGLELFDDIMINTLEKNNIPGGALAVSYKGQLVLARGYGYSKISLIGKEQVLPDSRFRIASLSKPVTATAIIRLMEENRLSIDQPVISLIKEVAPDKVRDKRIKNITVRQLLEHRGGFDRDKSGDPMFLAVPPCPGFLKSYLESVILDFTPGERYAYSNIGYCLLGRIIERATGESYESYVRKSILNSVGIHDMEIGSSLQTKPKEVHYYNFSIDKDRKTMPYGGFKIEDMDSLGGWIASTQEYLKFMTSLDGQRIPRILQQKSIDMMLEPPEGHNQDDEPVYYAKGFRVRRLKQGGLNFWHSGSLVGTTTYAVRYSSGYAYAAFFNSRIDERGNLYRDIDHSLSRAISSIKKPPDAFLTWK
jgi:N-acyl-D-amino-acid deacylase